jgi:SAM-dependent methyltransferase
MSAPPAYDAIGQGYAAYRVADPRLARVVRRALGNARTVVNVGAGAGSYEPTDLVVVAVEPSTVMAAQRPPHRPPAVLARAEELPFIDDAFDAAMAFLTLHHWSDARRGVCELQRVARRRVVLVTFDMDVVVESWLYRDYLQAYAPEHRRAFPAIGQLLRWLGANVGVFPIAAPRDLTDGFLAAYWHRPEALLDPSARAATSGFAQMDDDDERAIIAALASDLRSGAWDRRHGHLRRAESCDVGLRLIVAEGGRKSIPRK